MGARADRPLLPDFDQKQIFSFKRSYIMYNFPLSPTPDFQTFLRLQLSSIRDPAQRQGRGDVPGGGGGAMAPQDFGRSVNSISTRGAHYAHLITTGTPGFSDLPTALQGKISPEYLEVEYQHGGFQLLDLIITDLKSHMTCYNSMLLIG